MLGGRVKMKGVNRIDRCSMRVGMRSTCRAEWAGSYEIVMVIVEKAVGVAMEWIGW